MDVAGLASLPIAMPEGAGAAMLREDSERLGGLVFSKMLADPVGSLTQSLEQPASAGGALAILSAGRIGPGSIDLTGFEEPQLTAANLIAVSAEVLSANPLPLSAALSSDHFVGSPAINLPLAGQAVVQLGTPEGTSAMQTTKSELPSVTEQLTYKTQALAGPGQGELVVGSVKVEIGGKMASQQPAGPDSSLGDQLSVALPVAASLIAAGHKSRSEGPATQGILPPEGEKQLTPAGAEALNQAPPRPTRASAKQEPARVLIRQNPADTAEESTDTDRPPLGEMNIPGAPIQGSPGKKSSTVSPAPLESEAQGKDLEVARRPPVPHEMQILPTLPGNPEASRGDEKRLAQENLETKDAISSGSKLPESAVLGSYTLLTEGAARTGPTMASANINSQPATTKETASYSAGRETVQSVQGQRPDQREGEMRSDPNELPDADGDVSSQLLNENRAVPLSESAAVAAAHRSFVTGAPANLASRAKPAGEASKDITPGSTQGPAPQEMAGTAWQAEGAAATDAREKLASSNISAGVEIASRDSRLPASGQLDGTVSPDLGLATFPSTQDPMAPARQELHRGDTPQLAERGQKLDGASQNVAGSQIANNSAQYAAQVLSAQRPLGRPLAIAIGKTVQDGREHLRISLEPKDLGQLDVRLSIERNGSLRAVVTTTSEVSAELIRQDLPSLVRSLSDAGLKVDGGSIRLEVQADARGNSQQRQPREQQHSKHNTASSENHFVEEEVYAIRPLRAGSQIELRA